MSIRKIGDWAHAKRILSEGPGKLRASIGKSVREEAAMLKKEIVSGLDTQAPGGEPLKPLSPLTLAARRLAGISGTKALVVRGDLKRAIAAKVQGDEAFVGVPRNVTSKDGRSLIDVARVQEDGAGPIVIPLSPKMRRFLFVLLREVGRDVAEGTGQGAVIVTIPPRPFLRPAFDKIAAGADRRFAARVARLLGWGGR